MNKIVCKITKEECPHYSATFKMVNPNNCSLEELCKGVEFEETPEAIKHPARYAFSKYEPVKVIREWGLNFNLGNVIKYVARAGRKDDILQDLKKARQYLDFEIEALEEGASNG